MGDPLQCQLWFGSNGETHVKSLKGDLPMIFQVCCESLQGNVQVYQESGQTGKNAGIICDSNPGKKFSQGKEATAETILNEKKELKEQRMECSILECLQISRRRRRFQPIKWTSSE